MEIIEHLGYSDAIGGVATGFDELNSLHYWVRTTPWSFDNAISPDGRFLTRVHYSETPWNVDEMVGVRMDHKGQLSEFRAEPRKSVRTTPTKTIPKWEEWFSQEQLGFSLASLTESSWQITPPVVFDRLQSWEGTLPDGNRKIYVQAAAFQGRPVHFVLMDSKAFELTLQDELAVRSNAPAWAYVLVLDLVLIIVLGTCNLYLGRGDRSGATKIVIVFGILALVIWFLNGQHEFDLAEELQGFQSWLGIPAYFAAAIWLRYVALEPTIRRTAPDLLISWSRLLKGRFLNPMVQRDILIGLSAGAIVVVSDLAASYWTGKSRTLWDDCEALNSNWSAMGIWVHESIVFMTWALIWTFLIAVLNPVVRSRVLGSLIFFVVSLAMAIAEGSSLDLLMFEAIRTIILLAVIQRFGLLTLMAMGVMFPLTLGIPLTTDTTAFFFQRGLLPTVLIVAIACLCFVVSTAPNRQIVRRNA